MTLIVRDEVDVLDAHLRYHFAHGVDHVLAIDDRSTDGSSEVLEAHARSGRLTLVERPDGEMFASQSRWATQLARLASNDHGADWVINGDADEFWWPLEGTLDQALSSVPATYDLVLVPRTDFVFFDEGGPELMTVRESRSVAGLRVAHRGAADIVVGAGHHRVARDAGWDRLKWTESGEAHKAMRAAPAFPLRVFHYPLRSWAGLAEKARTGPKKALARDPVLRILKQRMGLHDLRAAVVAADPRPPEARNHLIQSLLSDGDLVHDDRIRDALAELSGGATPPSAGRGPTVPAGVASEELEVAGLVLEAMLKEDRSVRTRAGRFQAQVGAMRSSRWWRMRDGLVNPRGLLDSRLDRLRKGHRW